MAQQKGMKRAQKVLARTRKIAAKKKAAHLRRIERGTEVAHEQSAKAAS